MSSFSCGITGELCKEPAVTPSGGVFERKIIERWISENGTDPDTKQALSKDELVQMKQSPKVIPATPSSVSINSIIKTLMDEYDATVLYNAKVAKDVDGNNKELIEQVYTHDAACRVIRSLTEQMRTVKADLDQARQEIEVPVAVPENDSQAMEEESVEGVTEAILERLSANATKLTEQRKQRGRKPPPELTSTSEISKFEVKSNFSALHSMSRHSSKCVGHWWKR
jgi:pre-mRNA-processing factor 19